MLRVIRITPKLDNLIVAARHTKGRGHGPVAEVCVLRREVDHTLSVRVPSPDAPQGRPGARINEIDPRLPDERGRVRHPTPIVKRSVEAAVSGLETS